MDNIEATTKLLQEVGPLLEPLAITFDPEDGSWNVAVDEDTVIGIALDEASGMLVFVLELGPVEDAAAERAHEILLRFSFLWRDTGGIQAALDDEGTPVLIYRRPLAGLDTPRLRALLANLAAQREPWMTVISTAPQSETHVEEGVPGFIRV